MENKILKKGDIVSFDLSGKTLSGKVVEMSYGSAYKVIVNNTYYVVDGSELSKEGKEEKPTKKVGRPPKDKTDETPKEETGEADGETKESKVENQDEYPSEVKEPEG